MKFGVFLGNDPSSTAAEATFLADRGFDSLWFGEVPTVGWGDPFICMAQAAAVCDSHLGTAVIPAGIRPLPTLMGSIGTINRIAPGRTTLGYGSGALSRGIIGLPGVPAREFRADVAAIRTLLDGGEVTTGRQPFALHQTDRHCVDFADPIRFMVAAGGPRNAAAAGEHGDGMLLNGLFDVDGIRDLVEAARGARSCEPDAPFPVVLEGGPLCVLGPHETLGSPRVIARIQPVVSTYLGYFASLRLTPDAVPAEIAEPYGAYLGHLDHRYGPTWERRILGAAGENYCGRVERHDEFVTPAAIEALSLTGSLDFVADRLRQMECAGVTEVAVLRRFDQPWHIGDMVDGLLALRESVE